MLEKIKKMRKNDYKHLLKIIITFFPGMLFRILKRDIWIISERENDAKDNGYYLFKYIQENNLKENVFYAINKKSNDYKKIEQFDSNIIEFGSLKHHLYTWACSKNIGSQVGSGLPSRICFTLQKLKIYRFKSVFLQHGIIGNKLEWLMASKNKIDLFCATSSKEKDFIIKELGYPEAVVKRIGLCRYDGLISNKENNMILFMPTWRKNLVSDNIEEQKKYEEIFLQSDYYKTIQSYIENQKLIDFLEKSKYTFYLYLHDNFQIYNKFMRSNNERIIIADKSKYDIQQLMKDSAYLITDYSSVAFDFAYMEKPLQYFQFDLANFRKQQYEEGYFKYQEDGFGEVINTEENSINNIIVHSKNNFKMEEKYINRVHNFFQNIDRNNCKRTFEEINKL